MTMSPHQTKVVPANGLILGFCQRAACTCGWMGPLRPNQTAGSAVAINMATQDGNKHLHNLSKENVPDFILRINEEPSILVEEPSWR